MTREEKGQVIDNLADQLSKTPYFYITDTGGLTVAQVNAFRKLCFERGVEYKVVKNTLIKKALERLDADYTPFDNKVLKGFSGIMFSPENSNLPAKLIQEFRKKDKKNVKPVLKGASIDTDLFIGEENLDLLSKLKSKNELIGDIIGLLQSPAKNVISGLQGGGNKLAGILKTLSER
jgi:large subunit ribosomal protein L10